MTIMQLFNIILFWVFFGFLASFIAKRKNRNPLGWFFIGFFFSLLGVLLVAILPNGRKRSLSPKKPLASTLPKRSESWMKMWYYLDRTHAQQGPLEFPDLIKEWKEKGISETSYIWGEGMQEWKKLSEMPDLVKEIEQS